MQGLGLTASGNGPARPQQIIPVAHFVHAEKGTISMLRFIPVLKSLFAIFSRHI
jgi:hypothetical protein